MTELMQVRRRVDESEHVIASLEEEEGGLNIVVHRQKVETQPSAQPCTHAPSSLVPLSDARFSSQRHTLHKISNEESRIVVSLHTLTTREDALTRHAGNTAFH